MRHSGPEPVQIGGRPHLIDWRLGHLPSVLKKMARAARRMAGLGLDVEPRRHFHRSVRLAKNADGRKLETLLLRHDLNWLVHTAFVARS